MEVRPAPRVWPTAEPTATPAAVVAICANIPGCCGAAAAGEVTGCAAEACVGGRYAAAGAAIVEADLDWELPPKREREDDPWEAGAGLLEDDLGISVGCVVWGREVCLVHRSVSNPEKQRERKKVSKQC